MYILAANFVVDVFNTKAINTRYLNCNKTIIKHILTIYIMYIIQYGENVLFMPFVIKLMFRMIFNQLFIFWSRNHLIYVYGYNYTVRHLSTEKYK